MATFVIVPGGCTPSTLFQDFCALAHAQEVAVVAVQLPAVGRRLGQPAPRLGDDVRAIRQVAEPLLDQGHEVIVVTSSLGGVAGTQCLEYLSSAARASRGLQGGVNKIVYVTSMILEVNTSPMDYFGEHPPPFMNITDDIEYIEWTDEIDDGTTTFSDLPAEEAKQHRAKMEKFHSRYSFEDRLTYPGYEDVEVHYVLCEDDHVLTKEAQLGSIETLRRHAGREVRVHPIPAGHLPFVSRPVETLQILRAIAAT
ncbi:hypothetical protein SPI_05895 [Niveomyces insectorum RCEF 264]|uniref:AB hydrolase-1 domain-containing protein n=1 Tax=Niveomyces insectorum RCEF 264 TaxID=1081102 RepID=A0A167SK79_9HYPO|nr:hypothetical protein SPI_05895 [Niveomyces insectorum RCEF 264]